MVESDNPYDSPTADFDPVEPRDAAYLDDPIDAERAIVAEGVLTERDLSLAHILHGTRRTVVVALTGMLVVLIVVVLATVELRDLRPGFGQVFAIVSVAGLLCAIVFGYFYPRIAAQQLWMRRPTIREPFRRLYTDELVQTMTPVSNVTVRWSVYSRYRRSNQIVMLYLNDHARMFTIIPRHAFRAEDDWQRFLQLVEEKLPER